MPSYYLSEDLARFGEIARTNPKLFDLFLQWYSTTMEPGALDEKTKKLIALAVAFAIQEPYCIDSYASACTDGGISPEEMAEAVNVAAVIRGGARRARARVRGDRARSGGDRRIIAALGPDALLHATADECGTGSQPVGGRASGRLGRRRTG